MTMLEMISLEMLVASETGQTVVVRSTTLVTMTEWMASVPPLARALEMAAVLVAAGQLVMVGAHEMTVATWVMPTVRVVTPVAPV